MLLPVINGGRSESMRPRKSCDHGISVSGVVAGTVSVVTEGVVSSCSVVASDKGAVVKKIGALVSGGSVGSAVPGSGFRGLREGVAQPAAGSSAKSSIDRITMK